MSHEINERNHKVNGVEEPYYFPHPSDGAGGATTHTVNFTSGMSAATIQALIDAVPRYIPSGVIVTFQFGDGTYSSLGSGISFDGSYGGGIVNIFGNRADGDILYNSQSVHLDFTGDATNGISLTNINCSVEVRNLKITIDDGFIGLLALKCLYTDARFCYYVNVAKTNANSAGVKLAFCPSAFIRQSYFSGGHSGIVATQQTCATSHTNDDIGTLPNYVLNSSNTAVIGKVNTQQA